MSLQIETQPFQFNSTVVGLSSAVFNSVSAASLAGGVFSGDSATLNGALNFTGVSQGAPDTILVRDGAANIVALQNSINSNTFRVYNAYYGANNYERGALTYSPQTSAFTIAAESTGLSAINRDIWFKTAGNTRMVITSAGIVGVGTPTPILYSDGSNGITLSSTNGARMTIQTTNPSYNASLQINGITTPSFGFGDVNSPNNSVGGFYAWYQIVGDYANKKMTFRSLSSGNVLFNTMTLDLSGNVGIGTTTPSSTLTVKGPVSSSNIIYDGTSNSTQWNAAYTTVNSNSASWTGGSGVLGNNAYTTVNANSANWQNTYTVVNANSASWVGGSGVLGNNAYTTVNANSANWNGSYTWVNTNSANATFTTSVSSPSISASFIMTGGFEVAYTEKTSNYSIRSTDCTVNCTANSFVVQLPASVTVSYQLYNIKNTGSGLITLSANAAELIDGQNTLTIPRWNSASVQSTGSGWIIL